MIIKSDKKGYDGEKYAMPIWQLDTTKYIVTHYTEETHAVETTPFHAECIRYHIDSIRTKNADILKDMVGSGEILDYLKKCSC